SRRKSWKRSGSRRRCAPAARMRMRRSRSIRSRKRRAASRARHEKRGATSMIRIKRTYEPAARTDGKRILVERLWPRGVKKEALEMDFWQKDVAPSTALRQWYGHEPERWPEFRRRYEKELSENAAAWKPLLEAAQKGTVTLLFSAHDVERNGAVVLRDFLARKLERRSKPATKSKRRSASSEARA